MILAMLVFTFGVNTAMADILPEGNKSVSVCASLNNIEDFTDELSVYTYEVSPGGDKTLEKITDDKCLNYGYKFNQFSIFAITVEHENELDMNSYDPTEDDDAYPTSPKMQYGSVLVDESSNLDKVENEYKIKELDIENEVLVVEAVQYTKYFDDESDAEVVEGEVYSVGGDENQEEGDESTQETQSSEETQVTEETQTTQGTQDTQTTEETQENLFTDVDSTSVYFDALKYLKGEGIIGGYPDGSYKAETTINRAEFTKIIVGSISTEDELSKCVTDNLKDGTVALFSDVEYNAAGSEEEPWYLKYVCVAKEKGIIGGYPDGTFKPAQDINFVEASKIIVEGFGYTTTETEPWYKRYVTELVNKHAVPMTLTTFAQKITRGEMAEMMYRLKAEKTELSSQSYENLK